MKLEFVINKIESHVRHPGYVIVHLDGYVEGHICYGCAVVVPISHCKSSNFDVGDKVDCTFSKESLV